MNTKISTYTANNMPPKVAYNPLNTNAKTCIMNYRYGFNGQEKVNEVYGFGNLNIAEFWLYDTRLARRWNRDPIDQISMSNYSVLSNSPIIRIDPNGDDDFKVYENGEMERIETKDKFDRLVTINETGEEQISKHFKKGVFEYNIGEGIAENRDGKFNYNYFTINGDEEARYAFEFLTESLKREFSWLNYADDFNQIVTTKNVYTQEPGGLALAAKEYVENDRKIIGHAHSHPGIFTSYPSNNDMDAAKTIQGWGFNTKFFLYTPLIKTYELYDGTRRGILLFDKNGKYKDKL